MEALLRGETAVPGEHVSGLGEERSWCQAQREGLGRAYEALARGEASSGMRALFPVLAQARAVLCPEDWKRFCEEVCLAHPLRELVHQDPITRRSFTRPRGYAGDAVLLDLMYQPLAEAEAGESELGLSIYRHMYAEPNAISLRSRRNLLARRVDEVAERTPGANVLSVACGHLREAWLSQAVRERRLGRFLALDQDTRSLAVVERELGPLGVEAVPGSVKALLKGELTFAGLDFIYAAGLYDYLPQPVAIRLTRVLFSMLRSGGRLLLANYAEDTRDPGCRAYMEAFMRWWLLYREEAEVEEWLGDISRRELLRSELFRDEEVGNIIYLEATRR